MLTVIGIVLFSMAIATILALATGEKWGTHEFGKKLLFGVCIGMVISLLYCVIGLFPGIPPMH